MSLSRVFLNSLTFNGLFILALFLLSVDVLIDVKKINQISE